ncbi:uncharacterized protein PV09_00811 [Verruconis gallopava]|uniref:Zn(2)-C6 fungal-type domain-containing protein n=1 Tax=Verruconis gallopava TaxID=253628 RepID=A0A0D2BBY9_9PEZI|nr:uncharacterized protein PV09_00811 [Verruconis gallopava]KIW08889.1 hypothetical protein PV09_00811 [Verruconis gallopava]
MSSGSATTSAPVKRACDSCHRRKVKCIGEGTNPCKNCMSARLNCTYNAIPQKKGPKGSRAKVLSEIRETQRQSQLSAGQYEYGISRSISPAALSRTPGLVTPEIVNACVDYFFSNLYPTLPILHHRKVQQTVMAMGHSIEAYCKMVSLCAYTLFQPNMVLPSHVRSNDELGQISNIALARLYLDEAIRVRKGYEFSEDPTIIAVYTSFFIFSCYFCLDRQNAAWVYLRQAMTLAHVMGMHDESSYKNEDFIDSSRKRRFFWVLFMTERAYAFKRHRPLTLYDTIELPTVDEDPTETVQLTGFIHLIKLYKPFDETFFGLWNRTVHGTVPSWLVQLQQQLSDALPTYLDGTETQVVDLKISQQWLKIMIWQLAISHGFISSMASDNTLSFRFPIEISRELVEMAANFSQHAMEVHGSGIVEKLFDVACTLVDVMACVPLSPTSYDMGPRQYLNSFVSLISSLRVGQSRFLPLLQNKIAEVLPSYQLPSHPRLDMYGSSSQSATPNPGSSTPYDGSSSLALRHNVNQVHYPEETLGTLPTQLNDPSTYTPFSSSVRFQGTTTTADMSGSGLYHTHLPRSSGYPG